MQKTSLLQGFSQQACLLFVPAICASTGTAIFDAMVGELGIAESFCPLGESYRGEQGSPSVSRLVHSRHGRLSWVEGRVGECQQKLSHANNGSTLQSPLPCSQWNLDSTAKWYSPAATSYTAASASRRSKDTPGASSAGMSPSRMAALAVAGT
jgi:hypothetical protein